MAKRFADTEIWKKSWFQKINETQRMLFIYMLGNCDCAGVFEPDEINFSFFIKTDNLDAEISAINKNKKQIKKLENGRYFIVDYIEFQYFSTKVKYLNPKNNAHLGVIKCLMKNNIDYKKYLAPSEPLVSPCLGALDMDKDKDKDNILNKQVDTLKEEKEEKTDFSKIQPESPLINQIEKYHKKRFKNKQYKLSARQKQEICKITNENQLTFDDWKVVLLNASGGWTINTGGNQFKRVKPCFDKILEKWERFYNNEYGLNKPEKDEDEETKKVEAEQEPANIVKAEFEPIPLEATSEYIKKHRFKR